MKNDTLFVSYAHADDLYLNRLTNQLKAAAFRHIDCWDDRRIQTGEQWHKEIQSRLKKARGGILMVSASFLSSQYIGSHEIPVLLQNYHRRGTLIFPIIVRPCPWEEHPWLKELNIHKPLTPLSSLRVDRQEQKLCDFVREIKRKLS